jgi:hypothetical protein
MSRWVTIMAVSVALSAGLVGLRATADGATAPARLQATGSGTLQLNGNMIAFGLMPRRARIVVVDRRGDAKMTLNGRNHLRPLGSRTRRVVRLRGVQGRFYVKGRNVSISMRGGQMTVSAAGAGAARLRGVGVYAVNESASRSWSREWTTTVRLRRDRD